MPTLLNNLTATAHKTQVIISDIWKKLYNFILQMQTIFITLIISDKSMDKRVILNIVCTAPLLPRSG